MISELSPLASRLIAGLAWAEKCAHANPGIRFTASINDWRVSYTLARDNWPVVGIHLVYETATTGAVRVS